MKILVVEDDPGFREKLKQALIESAFLVDEASSAQEAIQLAERYLYTAGLLDLYLPGSGEGMDGIDLMEELRELQRQLWQKASPAPGLEKEFHFPVLMLTKAKDCDIELKAFAKGANDFIYKRNFDPRVLLIRLRNIISGHPNRTDSVPFIECGPVKINLQTMKTYVGEKQVSLTRKEFQLLSFLIQENRVVGHSFLIENLWESDSNATKDDLYVLASNLRRKLKTEKKYKLIVRSSTVPGYSLMDD